MIRTATLLLRGRPGSLAILICVIVMGGTVATGGTIAMGGAVPAGAMRSAVDPAPGRFIAVGDSIILGARSQLESRLAFLGWPSVLDMEVNRSTIAGAEALASQAPGSGDTVVISLGANDSGNPDLFRSRAEKVVAAGAGADTVYWLTIAEVRPYYPGTNAIIRELAARYPNVEVIDWAAVAGADPSLTAHDGLHLTPAGTVAMADEIIRVVLGQPPMAAAPVVPPAQTPAQTPPADDGAGPLLPSDATDATMTPPTIEGDGGSAGTTTPAEPGSDDVGTDGADGSSLGADPSDRRGAAALRRSSTKADPVAVAASTGVDDPIWQELLIAAALVVAAAVTISVLTLGRRRAWLGAGPSGPADDSANGHTDNRDDQQKT